MSLLKRINWKTLAPTFLLVAMSLCYLLNVEKLGGSTLTSKATSFRNTQEYSVNWSKSYNQWTIENNYILSTPISLDMSSFSSLDYIVPQSLTFIGTTTQNYELEWGFIQRTRNSNVSLLETNYYPSNTRVDTLSEYFSPDDPSNTWPAWTIYIRRVDGGILTPSDMEKSLVVLKTLRQRMIEIPTNPDSWYETTTQSIPTYTTQTTMVTTVDYEGYLSTLTIPVDVRPAIATLDQLINDLWSLHYIPFVVCFALIMGLAIWLLH